MLRSMFIGGLDSIASRILFRYKKGDLHLQIALLYFRGVGLTHYMQRPDDTYLGA